MSDTDTADRAIAPDRRALEAAQQLCGALECIGDALVRVDVEALLTAEEVLSSSVGVLSGAYDMSDRRAALDAVRRARAALLRCRRLGASFSNVARSFVQVGLSDGYDRTGDYLDEVVARSSLKVMA